jgi:Rv2175c C-terminal domain of unknown function/Protein of unknown function (DUF2384)
MNPPRDATDWATERSAYKHNPHADVGTRLDAWNELSWLAGAVINPKPTRDQPEADFASLGAVIKPKPTREDPDPDTHMQISYTTFVVDTFGFHKSHRAEPPTTVLGIGDYWQYISPQRVRPVDTHSGSRSLEEMAISPSVTRKEHSTAVSMDFILDAVSAFKEKLIAALQPSATDDTGPGLPEVVASLVRPPLSSEERASLLVSAAVKGVIAENELVLESAPAQLITTAFSISEKSLWELVDSGGVLAFQYQSRMLFPLWQFDPASPDHLVPHLGEVLSILQYRTPEEVIDWLRTPKRRLDGRSPLDALRHDEHSVVLRMAQAVGAS